MSKRIDPAGQHDDASSNTEPPLSPCPSWCEHPTNLSHDWEGETEDGCFIRNHRVQYPTVVSSTEPVENPALRREAGVDLVQSETIRADGTIERREVRIALEAMHYPHFTPAEARQVAADLIAAANRANEIEGAATHVRRGDAIEAVGPFLGAVAAAEREMKELAQSMTWQRQHEGGVSSITETGYREAESKLAGLLLRLQD